MKLWQSLLQQRMAHDYANVSSYLLDGVTGKAEGAISLAPFASAGALSAWVRLPYPGGHAGTYQRVLQLASGVELRPVLSGGVYYLGARWYAASGAAYSTALLSSGGVAHSTWLNLSCTWARNGFLKCYSGGVYRGQVALPDEAMRTSGTTLGLSVAEWVEGLADELSAWSAELSGAGVAALASGGKPANLLAHSQAASLRAWWRADGDSLPTVTDRSGNGVTGTATAGVTLSASVP